MNRVQMAAGRMLAAYLEKQTRGYVPFSVIPPTRLRMALRPGDVLLVEGDRRISAAIKYNMFRRICSEKSSKGNWALGGTGHRH